MSQRIQVIRVQVIKVLPYFQNQQRTRLSRLRGRLFFPLGRVGFSVTNCKMVGFLPTSFLGTDTQTQVGMFTKFFSVVKEKSNCEIV